MTKHMICRRAICPYYRHEDRQVIYCQGVQDGNVIHMAFDDGGKAKDYKLSRCRSCYKLCDIYKMLDKKEVFEDDG